jgi:hypothetical protein
MFRTYASYWPQPARARHYISAIVNAGLAAGAGLAPANAQPMAHGGMLRAEIAAVLETEPEATGPRVIEALRASYAGTPPKLRIVRCHLQALRGNGNGNGNGNAA